MLAVEGIYRDNQLILNKKVSFSEPVRVIVTFLDEPQNDSQKIDLAQFSFGQSRAILKELRGLTTITGFVIIHNSLLPITTDLMLYFRY